MQRICKRIEKGDKDAACELLELFYQKIYGYLRRLCGNVQDSEDLTQDTFAKVWLSLNNCRNKKNPSMWIHKIAYSAYVDWYRKKINKQRDEHWWKEYAEQRTNSFDKDIAVYLYEMVEKIDEDKRHAIYLHYYQGLSIKETAIILDISASTVKYRLRKAVETLRHDISL